MQIYHIMIKQGIVLSKLKIHSTLLTSSITNMNHPIYWGLYLSKSLYDTELELFYFAAMQQISALISVTTGLCHAAAFGCFPWSFFQNINKTFAM